MLKMHLVAALFAALTGFFYPAAHAADIPAVYVAQVQGDFETTYKRVYTSLENNRFYVVFEPDIGANLAGFAGKWPDHNLNKLERIKSMVFCNGWYANQVSNADPDMLALCPLSLTMTHKDGVTKVLFVRPDYVARGSAVEKIATELTADVIKAIEQATR